jgi:DNA replication protein DnaC
MRDEQSWMKSGFPKATNQLTPRLAKDLRTIPYKWVDIPEIGSYFIEGPIGSGKTLLAAWIWMRAKRDLFLNPDKWDNKNILFITVPEFLNEIKTTYDNNHISAQEVLDMYCNAGFLVLDDLGAERTTDWAMSMLYLLINRRYEGLKPTVFTCNMDLDTLSARLGDERIPGRIERMCELIAKTGY